MDCLKNEKFEIENALKRKNELIASFAHEARNQLSGIMGLSEVVISDDIPEHVKDNVKMIYSTSEAMLSMMSDMLDASKIEAGRLELENVEFNMWKVVEDLTKLYEARARRKGLKLLCYVASEVPEILLGDPAKFRQAVGNLLTNAIKFTEKGEITLKIGLGDKKNEIADERARVEIKVTVSDTGVGIPLEKQPLLFEQFVQADPSVYRKHGGTGLGLFITRSIVEKMGGKVSLESIPGVGSRFSFTAVFSVAEFESVPFLDQKDFEEGSRIRQKMKRIVVIDDNFVNRALLTDVLTGLGHAVVCAENGSEALDMMVARNFDLVIMDLQMPVMDGFETAAEIRRGDRCRINRSVPIVGVTASALKSDRARCADAGMNAFMTRPLKVTEIASIIDYLCEGEKRLSGAASGTVLDIEKSLIRYGNNEELYYMACDSFKKTAPAMINTIYTEYRTSDFKALAQTARELKTFARAIGAEPLKEVLLHIEFAAGGCDEWELNGLMQRLGSEFCRVDKVLSGINR